MRWATFVLAVVMIAGLGTRVPSRAEDPPEPNGTALVEACRQSQGEGSRTCRSLEQAIRVAAQACRQTPADPVACARADGRVVAESEMAEFEISWAHRALALQRGLDDAVPLTRALLAHTHNSYNAQAYPPTFSGLDANNLFSLRDQLRMGIRALELDVHWFPSPHGDPATAFRTPVMCHGRSQPAAGTTVHVGCTAERPLSEGLAEIRGWLDDPPNAGEVLLLYLENHLDGDPVAHASAIQAVEQELGSLVYRPSAGEPCAPLPLGVSRSDIRASGPRVLIVGNCGPGPWGSWVHERGVGPVWFEEKAGAAADDYPDEAGCEAERTARGYGQRWIRYYEDSTWLSAMASSPGVITPEEARRMVACGVNMPGFDQLHPDDGRLPALVWSWAPDQPGPGGGAAVCASQGADGRFRSGDCGQSLSYACYGPLSGQWRVTAGEGAWDAGPTACAAEFPGSVFAVPPNGYENRLLLAARPPGTSVWLGYSDAVGDGRWTARPALT